MLGAPTGFTLKYWTSNQSALDLGLTYAFNNSFAFLLDYLWHFTDAFSSTRMARQGNRLNPYLGIGAVVFVNSRGPYSPYYYYDPFFRGATPGSISDVALGMRIPLGLEFIPKSVPLGVFAEVAPGITVLPGIYGFVQGVIGARFYF